jgi:hypothetical protein
MSVLCEADGRAKASPPREAQSVNRDVRHQLIPQVLIPSVSDTLQLHSEYGLPRKSTTSAICYGAVLQIIHWSLECAEAGCDVPVFQLQHRGSPPNVKCTQSGLLLPASRFRSVAMNRDSSGLAGQNVRYSKQRRSINHPHADTALSIGCLCGRRCPTCLLFVVLVCTQARSSRCTVEEPMPKSV